MAQSYFPAARVASPVKEQFDLLAGDKQLRVEDVQEAYVEQKDRLVHAIDSTTSVLDEIRKFNKEEWVIRYPQLAAQPAEEGSSRKIPRRSLSFVDDPLNETDVVVQRPGHGRSVTVSSASDAAEAAASGAALDDKASDFQILRLDLKIGAANSSHAATLVSQLEKASIANLIDERITASISHMSKLRARVEDTSSKVLVTGDLNAGKSTFVNALLRREVMPVDQQPCTTAFCEVHDAAENEGKEEVHVVRDGAAYDIKDGSTYTPAPISDLEEIIGEHEDNINKVLIKLYLADTRAPAESLLNNGVVDISLIDAPGLNRDSLKTTAVFARQEEIDVVVFVVSAENHFTLSAKEFLQNASNEKAYLFIVVNKYDQIKNKEKCKRLVLDQIRQLSPGTYEDAEDLVHFVDSASALQPFTANPAFDDLESALRSFVLVKRSKSKLGPVQTYLSNLLGDVELLAGTNKILAEQEHKHAMDELAAKRPVLEKMKGGRDALEEGLESVEEDGVTKATTRTRSRLTNALDLVGQGKVAVEEGLLQLPSWPGLLGVWDYTREVRRVLLASLDAAVKLAEDEARLITTSGVTRVKDLGESHLPEGVERSRRVFMPEAMFSTIRRGAKASKSRRSSTHGAVVAGGMVGLGIGLSQRPEMLDTTFFDIFDVSHQFWVNFGDKEDSVKEDEGVSALSIVSVGAGALSLVGGKAIGARGLVEGVMHVADLFGNEGTRKWIAPVVGAFAIGATAYFVLELPSTIPRTVGRRVRNSVVQDGAADGSEGYVEGNAKRVGRETRKVLRLASWDLKERFRSAMEERGKEVKTMEEMAQRANRAMEWFEQVGTRSDAIRVEARLGELSA
ncbi:hypothetical protein BD626DRAFT_465621 [Schizophyllum amplum]|uniref:Dynamin-type G domain-containing protein n=1 Tax=Schizophyllum amplum TaxID=97359 RepID=A0A550BWN6_9AGAR|nr:hypothetical protein BD626DRAFT_465621 [Auriculariopsis ampla]